MKTDMLIPTVDPVAVTGLWLLSLTARREHQILARILTKLAAPEIELLAVQYRVEEGSGALVRCGFSLRMTPAWADLLTAKLRQVVSVEEVAIVRL